MRRKQYSLLFFIITILYIVLTQVNASEIKNLWNKWELGIFMGLNVPDFDITYTTSYSPLLKNTGQVEYLSAASQVLNIHPEKKTDLGFGILLNHFFSKKTGIQLLGQYHKTTLKGTGNTFYSYIQYTAYPYPDFNPTIITVEKNEAWPDTDGSIKNYTFSLNIITRLKLGKENSIDLSAGPSFFNIKGEASSLGYLYWFMAHEIRVPFNYPIKFSFKSLMKLGVNLGIELNISLLSRLKLFINARYYLAPSTSNQLELVEILNFRALQAKIEDYIDEITSTMDLLPIKINPSFLIFSGGIKLCL